MAWKRSSTYGWRIRCLGEEREEGEGRRERGGGRGEEGEGKRERGRGRAKKKKEGGRVENGKN